MPKLSDYWQNFEEYTGKASDVTRQLSFAGIALIWLLREPRAGQLVVPEELIYALALFTLSLSFDLMQYIAASIVWGSFCRYHEKRLKRPEDNPMLTGPRWINWPADFFFIGKLALAIVAYVLLLIYFGMQILSS